MANRIFNLQKDEFDERDHVVAPAALPSPVGVNLGAKLGPVTDQGLLGSCTGEAGSGWMAWLYQTFIQYFPVKLATVEFSPLFLYAMERLKNGTFPHDAGSDSRTLMKILNQLGICLESDNPYSDKAGAVQPVEQMIISAARFRIGAYHRVPFDAELATAKSVLASGYCRVIGIPVYKDFESDEVAATGMLPVPGPRETPIGGHEMLAFGFDDRIKIGSNQGAEMVRNSWSESWGLAGNLYIPYNYYAAVGGDETCDSWTGHLGRPWRPKTP